MSSWRRSINLCFRALLRCLGLHDLSLVRSTNLPMRISVALSPSWLVWIGNDTCYLCSCHEEECYLVRDWHLTREAERVPSMYDISSIQC
jgi:hypothetical protein